MNACETVVRTGYPNRPGIHISIEERKCFDSVLANESRNELIRRWVHAAATQRETGQYVEGGLRPDKVLK